MLSSDDIYAKYINFFQERGHKKIPHAPLIPENDPTLLFVNSGMFPLVPYLLGATHPMGTRLVNSQPSFRTDDIEEVGDGRHTTLFEMLGNWSLGDYFKQEQLPWVFEFLTAELGLDPNKIFVTVFAGDPKNNLPRDDESVEIWKRLYAAKGIEAKDVEIGSEANGYKVGMQGGRIFYYEAKKNWWSRSGTPDKMPAGEPGGPDSELFFDFGTPHDPKFGEHCHPNCDCGRFVEIGNSVFMEYKKNEDGSFGFLPKKNVDFGGGFERLVMAVQGKNNVMETDIFMPIIRKVEEISGVKYEDNRKSYEVIADHTRATVFIMADGGLPSNVAQGYFVRRLIRRAIRYGKMLGIETNFLGEAAKVSIDIMKDKYPHLKVSESKILEEIKKEEDKFRMTLEKGLKEFEKISSGNISGFDAFNLFTTYGFPIEMTEELAKEKGLTVDRAGYEEELKKHQDLSRTASAGMFKGGLADHSEETTKLHTACHLMLEALRRVLGKHVEQKGSNITAERLRFDFSHGEKMTPEQIAEVEKIVNEEIQAKLPVRMEEMSLDDARNIGATGVFENKYGERVKVYFMGEVGKEFSKEICGGPHVQNTGTMGHFKIIKEEASSAGVRRIKAVLA